MPTPSRIAKLAHRYLAQEIVPLLPAEVGVLTVEIVAWNIHVHAYQYEAASDVDYERLDATVEALASVLPPRPHEPWQATMEWHRITRGEPPQYKGQIVYERWTEP